ncbi:MAG TPA: hypothetical protein GX736_03200 [Mogibacterium sp.]|nr:hypothetical protein [Mogibacterium sp.]
MKRKLVYLIACIMLMMPLSPQVFADSSDTGFGEPPIEHKYDQNINLRTYISLEKDNATVVCSVRDLKQSATKITTRLYFQKYSGGKWVNITNWSKSANGAKLTLRKSKTVKSGKYRAKSVTTIYKGGSSEKVTQYSSVISK